LMGKSVVTFAKNYFNDMPSVHYCDSPPRLPALINSLLRIQAPETRTELIAFLARLKARSFDGEFNRMYLPEQDRLTSEDVAVLQIAYNELFALRCGVSRGDASAREFGGS